MAKKRHRIGGGKRKRSRKVRLLDEIRAWKANAVQLRLGGNIRDAVDSEDRVDRWVSEAEKKGFGDQASRAEEAGMRIGQRLYRTRKG